MSSRPSIPAEVRKALRLEVGFGCPVQSCRGPFLEFHHFDPPWEEEEHFRPEGMVALCREHHGAASHWTKSKVRALKHFACIRKPVKGFFDAWEQSLQLVVRLGGNYTIGPAVPICVGNEPAFTLESDPENGWLQLSFALRNRFGEIVAEMDKNDFVVVPENVHDLHTTVTKHELKIWITSEDVGLDLAFRWRTEGQFLASLRKDRGTIPKAGAKAIEEMIAKMPPDIAQAIRSDYESMAEYKDTAEMLPEEIRTCMIDGRLPLLDVREMSIWRNGVRTRVKKGITWGKALASGNIVINAGKRGFNLPAYEQLYFRPNASYSLSNGMAQDESPESECEAKQFERQVIVVDGKKFTRCRFQNCDLVYKGGNLPTFSECFISRCLWVFDEAARNTLEWMHLLRNKMSPASKATIDEIIHDLICPTYMLDADNLSGENTPSTG